MNRDTAVKIALLAAIAALIFSVGSNVTLMVRTHQNCKNIELLKTSTRDILKESYDDLITGKNDKQLEKFYGPEWPAKKAELIAKAQRGINRFEMRRCPILG